MKITNETVYDWGAYVAMNRMVTRATHRGQSIALRVLFAALALLLLFAARFQFTGILQVLLALLGAVILLWTLFLNQLRAFLMVKLIMKGVKVFTNTFDQEGWTVAGVGGGEQRMSYDDIASILEGDRYFILLEDSRRGYILDKRTFASGGLERFRSLIQSKTKKTIQNV